MYYSRTITEFPYHGVFFTVPTKWPEDGDLIGDGDLLGKEDDPDTEGKEEEASEEIVLLERKCDIQQAAKLISSGTIMADYTVFFPCETGEKLPIRFNTNFRCDDYAIPINGRVVGLEFSELGGCSVDIKMSEV